MSRKPIQKFQIQRIVVLKSEGASISDIEKDTGLGRATIQKYIDKYKSDIEAMKQEPQDVTKIKPDEPAKKEKEKDKKPKKPAFQSIEEETTKKAISKGAESVSKLKAQEITEDYKAAQMLHSAAVRYQKNIEMMGLDWDRFVAYSIDEAYQTAVDVYKEKMEQQLREASLLQEAIEEDLENPEPQTEDGMTIDNEVNDDE